jgi:hypothetical protein
MENKQIAKFISDVEYCHWQPQVLALTLPLRFSTRNIKLSMALFFST